MGFRCNTATTTSQATVTVASLATAATDALYATAAAATAAAGLPPSYEKIHQAPRKDRFQIVSPLEYHKDWLK